MLKISGAVILFQPSENALANINTYAGHIQRLYIIDNTENNLNSTSSDYASIKGSAFIGDNINMGIAKRLNQACKMALVDGFDFLLTMDQDSFFSDSMITHYLKCISEYEERDNTAMFGITHSEKSVLKGFCAIKKVNTLITSGSIINLSVFKKLDGFDENLFIDLVDTDYCFSALEAGFDIVEISNIFMEHSIGNIVKKKSLKSFKVTNRSLHAPIRIYYMVRNFLYLKKKYSPLFKPDLKIYQTDLFNRIKNNLIYNKKRGIVLIMIFRAIIDFYQNKMGKYSESF